MKAHANIFGRNTSSNSLNNDQSHFSGADWVSVSRSAPCIACGKPDWCQVTTDGRVVMCHRSNGAPVVGWHCDGRERRNRKGEPHYIYKAKAGTKGARVQPPTNPTRSRSSKPAGDAAPDGRYPDISDRAADFESALTPALAQQLLSELSLPPWAADVLARIGVGWYVPDEDWKSPAWTFRARDEHGHTVGLFLRLPKASVREGQPAKLFLTGTHAGIVVPDCWWSRAIDQGVIFVVEGPSDTIAMTAAGLPVVGRFNNTVGADELAARFRALPPEVEIVVVGENDRKENGDWPGRWGAYEVADKLRQALGRVVNVATVPDGDKDSRDYLVRRAGSEGGRRRWETVGLELATALIESAQPVEEVELSDLSSVLAEDFPVRACRTPYHLQFRYKPQSARAGQYCAACARCDKWGCSMCSDWKASALIKEVAEALESYVAIGSVNRGDGTDGIDQPWPGDPGNLRQSGPWTLWAWFVPEPRREWLSRAIGRKQGEKVVTWTHATAADLEAAAGRNLGSWTREETPKSSCPKPAVSDKNAASEPETHSDPPKPRWCLVLAALPPGVTPPRGGSPVGCREFLHLFACALRHRPTAPQTEGGRLRVVEVSPGFRIQEAEEPGQAELIGQSAYSPTAIKTKVTDPLKISVEAKVAGRNIQGRGAGWDTGVPLLNWLISEYIKPVETGIQPQPDAIPPLYRKWEPHLRAAATAHGIKDPGPSVAYLVRLYLWSGPPPLIADELAAAAADDRVHAERAERHRAAMDEAREITESIRSQVRENPESVPAWMKELAMGPVISEGECKRRVERARRMRTPRWRRGDETKSKRWVKENGVKKGGKQ